MATGSGGKRVSRQEFEEKGRRYLAESRLLIRRATPDGIKAVCRGDSGTYDLGWEPERGWWCGCRSPQLCPHLFALQLITEPVPATR